MTTRKFSRIGAVAVFALAAVSGMSTQVLAQDKDQSRDQVQLRDQDQIYGSQRMTQQERDEYRNRIGAMKTEQEREAYRLEHRKRMQERERERDRTHDKGMQHHDGQILKPGMGGGAGKGK
jgi:hypothetical protein